jgi:hypothetical protein
MARWTKTNNPHTWGKRKMARRRTTTRSRAIVVRAPSKPQIIRVSAPRAPKHHRRRRHHAGGGGFGGGGLTRLGSIALGGAAYGFIEKMLPPTLTLPVIGRAGTIAILAHAMRGKLPFAAEVSNAAAVLAGYQLGSTGKISGDDEMHGDIARQISGAVAAQV